MSTQNRTSYVHGLLARFHAGQPLAEPVAFRKALAQLAFDYTPDAIARVDRLLAQLRSQRKPAYDDFMRVAEHRGFLRLLAYMVGEAVGRYRGVACRWLDDETLQASLAETVGAKRFAENFDASVVCEIEGEGLFCPLAAIEAALFAEKPPGVLAAADAVMRRAVDAPVLSNPGPPAEGDWKLVADPVWQLGQAFGHMANWCIEIALAAGDAFAPQFVQQHAGGQMLGSSLLDVAAEEAIEHFRRRLAQPEDGVAGQVLGHDGFVGLPEFRSDAILLEGAWYAGLDAPLRALLALPYRPRNGGRHLGLHDFRLLEFSADAAAAERLRGGLFARMAAVEPPGPWRRYFVDENAADHLAARRSALPPLPWERQDAADSGIALGDFALEKLREVEPLMRDVVSWRRFRDDPLLRNIPTLLGEGRVVWGVIVQANKDLHKPGGSDLPAEVVYSVDGSVLPEALAPVAHALSALRGDVPAETDDALKEIADYLNAETTRAFGWTIPPSLGTLAPRTPEPPHGLPDPLPDTLRLSSLWIMRRHLPHGYLAEAVLPLLLSDACPGYAMVVPAAAWPPALLAVWERSNRDRLRARWRAEWQRLAEGGAQADQAEFHRNADALAAYVKHGVSPQWLAQQAQFGLLRFPPNTQPPPQEWEWSLDLELKSRAERWLTQAEAKRALGQPLAQDAARWAFAARATAQMIAMHGLMWRRRRGAAENLFPLEADEIQYAALGLLVGCDAPALRLARLLVVLWRDPANYAGHLRPEVWIVFRIFARELGLALPAREPSKRRPCLDALLAGDAWKGDAAKVKALIEAACEEHVEHAPTGPFLALPIALALLLRLRERAGLANPAIDHELLRVPPGAADPVDTAVGIADGLDRVGDPLVLRVRERMQRAGYDEAAIEAAVLDDRPPGPAGPPLRPGVARSA